MCPLASDRSSDSCGVNAEKESNGAELLLLTHITQAVSNNHGDFASSGSVSRIDSTCESNKASPNILSARAFTHPCARDQISMFECPPDDSVSIGLTQSVEILPNRNDKRSL